VQGIISQIVQIATIVGDVMEQLGSVEESLATEYLEKLEPFAEHVPSIQGVWYIILPKSSRIDTKQTKVEIDHRRQLSYPTRLALHTDMAEILSKQENELLHPAIILSVSFLKPFQRNTSQTINGYLLYWNL